MSWWQVHLTLGERRNGYFTDVEADSAIEAASEAWAKCGRGVWPLIEPIPNESGGRGEIFRIGTEQLTVWPHD